MSRREKLLAAAVLTLVAAWFGASWYGKYRDTVSARRSAVLDAQSRLGDATLQLAAGRSAMKQLEEWQNRSLPSDRQRALSLYKAWLLASAKQAGLAVDDIKPVARSMSNDAFSTVAYQLDATGSLSAVAAMLYEFYRSPQLHQITRLRITRPAGGSQLQVDLEVEALSLPGATAADKLPEGDSGRLQLASLEEYQTSLIERDLASIYTPPRPPREPVVRREPPAPPKFDDAAHAYFTGTVGSVGALEAWINVRTTGEMLHVAAGDELKVGAFEGKVASVEPRSLVLKSGDKTIRVALGENLRAGKELAKGAATSEVQSGNPES